MEFSFLCPERRGTVYRKVIEVTPSPWLEKYLAEKLPQKENERPIKDLSHIYSAGSRIFLVDDVGVIIKGIIEYHSLVDVHVGFWDRILRGREDMCRVMAQILSEDAGSRGVWTAIPVEARATLAFAKRVGFKEEQNTGSIVLLTLVT